MATCYICGSAKTRSLYDISSGKIVRCLGCGTVFRAPVIAGEAYRMLYQHEATMESPFYMTNRIAEDPRVEPMPTFARGLARLRDLRAPGRLLDVGCSYGAFMALAQSEGWDCSGVELSELTARFARDQRHLDVFTGTVEQAAFPAGSFDVITLWDVVEHLDDPVATFAELHRIMAPGGILLVFTINQESLLSALGHMLYRSSLNRWKHLMELFYDIHHNFFFSPRTLAGFLKRSKFEVADIEFADANVRRWRTVPIPPLMILGADAVDGLAAMVGRRYRMYVYARKM